MKSPKLLAAVAAAVLATTLSVVATRHSPNSPTMRDTALSVVSGADTTYAATGTTGPITGIGGKCLTDSAGKVVDGNPIVLGTCIGSAAQQWTLATDGTIRNQNHCLAVQRAGTASKTWVWLYSCDRGPAQLWTVNANHTIVNPHSKLCLADSDAKTTNGNPIWVYTCDAGQAQLWKVPSTTTGTGGNTVDPSGQAMPVGDLPGWHQVFTDNFAQNVPLGSFPAAVKTKWTGYSGFSDTHGFGTYDPARVVSVSGGLLQMNLHTENGKHLVAAPVPIIPGHSSGYQGLTYGRYAVRFRATPAAGYKTAWLLWPDSDAAHPGGDWNNGEIDFPEGDLDSGIGAFMHHRGDPRSQEAYSTGATYAAGWHTAVVEWTPQSVTFTLDGKVIGNDTHTQYLPDTPMHWVLQTETASTAPSNAATSNVQVDWVSIWQRS